MSTGLDAVMEALAIFRKYGNPIAPLHCEHDTLYVMIQSDVVSEEDKTTLEELGFFPESDFGVFASFRFGSA